MAGTRGEHADVESAIAALGTTTAPRRDIEWALDTVRRAAVRLTRNNPGGASDLLSRAAETAGSANPDVHATLLVERAEADLRSGRLADARHGFREAVEECAGGDVELQARAAIGLGGLWVNEIRLTDERLQMLAHQSQARDALPEEAHTLRARLDCRLAAEDYYDGGPVEPVLAALHAARATGDALTIAEALSLTHHVLLSPDHSHDRVELADELIAVAAQANEPHLATMGLCWRAIDLFLLGDPKAERALEELRLRADLLDVRSLKYIVSVLDVMLRIRRGDLDGAEHDAERCLEIGTEVGDLDAVGYYGGHLVSIRWFQGRGAEVLPLVSSMTAVPTIAAADWIYVAVEAHLAGEAGDLDTCQSALDRLGTTGLDGLRKWSTWLGMTASVVEATRHVDDEKMANEAYDLLLPYADLPAMPSLAITCMGSVERPLGVAAMVCGRVAEAVDHLERAVERNRQLGNRPITCLTRADLAEALLVRDQPGDRSRARALLLEAEEVATSCGMAVRAERWLARAEEVSGASRPQAAGTHEAALIRRDGRAWTVTACGEEATVPHSVGMDYLHMLLLAPGVSVHVLDLAAGGARTIDHVDQEMTDDAALAQYRRRMEELVDDIADADGRGDFDRADHLRDELEVLAEEVRTSTGLGGRARRFAGPAERARTSVRKAIVRAISRIGDQAPAIAATLEATVVTGYECQYLPDPGAPIRWS